MENIGIIKELFNLVGFSVSTVLCRFVRCSALAGSLFIGMCSISSAGLPIGKPAKVVDLAGSDGGRPSGKKWSSEELKGKVHLLFYVDPDEKDLNEHVEKAIKAKDFSKKVFASVAVVNMKATWMPNFAIASKIKDKQKVYPETIYVLDKVGSLTRNWNLKTDSYDVVLFDKKGIVQFSKDGKLSKADVSQLLKTISNHL